MKTKRFSYYPEKLDFDSSMLEIGEMMEQRQGGNIIIRTYDRFVSLTNPSSTWSTDVKLVGRKLLPGEGISLIQE